MMFTTLAGNSVPIALAGYEIDWDKPSLSKFQTRIKKFIQQNFSGHWYEEVPLTGAGVNRLRWDFLCIWDDRHGKRQKVFVEVQGTFHNKLNPKFHKSIEAFDDQLVRDNLKIMFAAKNSNFPVIEIHEDDEPVKLDWFLETFGDILPRR